MYHHLIEKRYDFMIRLGTYEMNFHFSEGFAQRYIDLFACSSEPHGEIYWPTFIKYLDELIEANIDSNLILCDYLLINMDKIRDDLYGQGYIHMKESDAYIYTDAEVNVWTRTEEEGAWGPFRN